MHDQLDQQQVWVGGIAMIIGIFLEARRARSRVAQVKTTCFLRDLASAFDQFDLTFASCSTTAMTSAAV